MNELLDEKFSFFCREIVYRAGEGLLEHDMKLVIHQCSRESDLFSSGNTMLLYDLTNNYFESERHANPKMKYSANSMEKRTDCPQLSVGLVLN